MRSAVAYMRMSTDRQEHSIESQKRIIKEFADKNGYLLHKFYSDEGISGRIAEKRPAFMQMMEDSARGEFGCVIIYDSSRFARNLEQSLVYKSLLKKNGVELISVTEPSLDDDTSLITDALFGAMNEMYSRKLSKNVRRGMEQKALRGEYAGLAPFGYRYSSEKRTIVIHEAEARHVEYFFTETLRGRSAYSLAQEMRERGVGTQYGARLDRRRVEYILRNPAYKGYLRWGEGGNRVLRKSNHEAIVSEKLFDAVQELLERKSAREPRRARPAEIKKHWLSGLLRCSECGCTYTFCKGHYGRSDRLRCSGQSRGLCAAAISFTEKDITEKVLGVLREISSEDLDLYALNITLAEKPDHDRQINKLQKTMERARAAYLNGIDSLEDYADIRRKLKEEIRTLETLKSEQEAVDLDGARFRAALLNTLKVLESDAENFRKLQAAKEIIEKIVINKKNRHIKLYFFA